MKIKDTFILRNIAGSFIVVPIGSDMIDFNGMITLNETGAFLWDTLKEDKSIEDLVSSLLAEYEVSSEDAKNDAVEFVDKLKKAGIIVG